MPSGARLPPQTTKTTAALTRAGNFNLPLFRCSADNDYLTRYAPGGGRVATRRYKINALRSVNQRALLQTRDFVLHHQLATHQLYDFEIVDRRKRTGFVDFRFQGPVPPFKFRKMRLYGHVEGFS